MKAEESAEKNLLSYQCVKCECVTNVCQTLIFKVTYIYFHLPVLLMFMTNVQCLYSGAVYFSSLSVAPSYFSLANISQLAVFNLRSRWQKQPVSATLYN